MTGKCVLVVARDAGAASALAPVVRELLAHGPLQPQIVAYGKALAVFEAMSLPVFAFPEEPELEEIDEFLDASDAVAVLTGTSMRAELDGRFWAAAHAAGIPSVAVLDHWTNYAERFTVSAPFDRLPAVIAVMDEVAKRALVERGCPADRLRVTGHPRFDALPVAITPDLRARARRELGCGADRRVIVFASEPQTRYYGNRHGYTEVGVASVLLDATAAVAPDALVVFKLHPLEDVAGLWSEVRRRGIPEVRVLRSYPILELAAASDVFSGMTSIVLLDAAVLGVPTLSVRPGGGQSDFLDAHADLIESVTSADGVPAALARALESVRPRAPVDRLRRATRTVCDLLEALAGGGHSYADPAVGG